jgi:hypothetical protein
MVNNMQAVGLTNMRTLLLLPSLLPPPPLLLVLPLRSCWTLDT